MLDDGKLLIILIIFLVFNKIAFINYVLHQCQVVVKYDKWWYFKIVIKNNSTLGLK